MIQLELLKKSIKDNNREEIIKIVEYLFRYFLIYEAKDDNFYREIESYYSIISKINYEFILDIPILYLFYCILLKHSGKFNELNDLLEDYNLIIHKDEKKSIFFHANIFLLKSYIDMNEHKYKEALEKLEIALKKLDLYSDSDLLLIINYQIATVYYYLFNINKSLVYYKKSEYYILNIKPNSIGLFLRLKINIIQCLFMKNKINSCFEELNKLKIFIDENNLNNTPSIIYYYDLFATILFYKNEKKLLFECIDKILELFHLSSLMSICMVYINCAKSLILLNEFEKAKIIIDKIETYFKLKKTPERVRMFLYLLNFILAKKLNEQNECNAWFKEVTSITNNNDYYIESGVSILYAYFFLESNNIKEAEKIYNETVDFFSQKDCDLFNFKIELLKIAIDYKNGDTFKSRVNLKEKLFFSQKDWNIGIYLESSNIILLMIYEIYNESINKKSIIEIKYLEKIIAIIDKNLKFKIHFTEKEIEILKLVNKGFSNKEIAGELFISINTLKTHIRVINTKLETSNKEEALIKAKEYIAF